MTTKEEILKLKMGNKRTLNVNAISKYVGKLITIGYAMICVTTWTNVFCTLDWLIFANNSNTNLINLIPKVNP